MLISKSSYDRSTELLVDPFYSNLQLLRREELWQTRPWPNIWSCVVGDNLSVCGGGLERRILQAHLYVYLRIWSVWSPLAALGTKK